MSDACIFINYIERCVYFYKLHDYLIALIKIMLKYICHILHVPAPSPSLIPVLLLSHNPVMFRTKYDYLQFNLIIC